MGGLRHSASPFDADLGIWIEIFLREIRCSTEQGALGEGGEDGARKVEGGPDSKERSMADSVKGG